MEDVSAIYIIFELLNQIALLAVVIFSSLYIVKVNDRQFWGGGYYWDCDPPPSTTTTSTGRTTTTISPDFLHYKSFDWDLGCAVAAVSAAAILIVTREAFNRLKMEDMTESKQAIFLRIKALIQILLNIAFIASFIVPLCKSTDMDIDIRLGFLVAVGIAAVYNMIFSFIYVKNMLARKTQFY